MSLVHRKYISIYLLLQQLFKQIKYQFDARPNTIKIAQRNVSSMHIKKYIFGRHKQHQNIHAKIFNLHSAQYIYFLNRMYFYFSRSGPCLIKT